MVLNRVKHYIIFAGVNSNNFETAEKSSKV